MAEKNGGKAKIRQETANEISPFPVCDPAELTKISSRNLAATTRAAQACFNGAAKFNQELLGFANRRVKKETEAAASFMSSKSSEEAFHTQAMFVEQTIRDYADEASKILHLAADMAKEALTPVEERTEQVLHYIDEHGKKPQAAE